MSFSLLTPPSSTLVLCPPPQGGERVADNCRLADPPRVKCRGKGLAFLLISQRVSDYISGSDWVLRPLEPVYLVMDVRLELGAPPLEADVVPCGGRDRSWEGCPCQVQQDPQRLIHEQSVV